MSFYDKFEFLCNAKGITPTQAARENGITQQAASHWKTRNSTPKYETLKKIADYFGVSVNYLTGEMGEGTSRDDEMRQLLEDALWQWAKRVAANTTVPATVWAELDEKINDGSITDEEFDLYEKLASMEAGIALNAYSEGLQCLTNRLNESGKKKLEEYANDLAKIAEYRAAPPALQSNGAGSAQEAPESPPPPTEGKDTTPAPDAPETVPEGE